jgi:hypothetical protein
VKNGSTHIKSRLYFSLLPLKIMLPFTSKIEIEHRELLLLVTCEMESTQLRFVVKSETVLMIDFVMISTTKYLQVTEREISSVLLQPFET